jgi:hypothetical protein
VQNINVFKFIVLFKTGDERQSRPKYDVNISMTLGPERNSTFCVIQRNSA